MKSKYLNIINKINIFAIPKYKKIIFLYCLIKIPNE